MNNMNNMNNSQQKATAARQNIEKRNILVIVPGSRKKERKQKKLNFMQRDKRIVNIQLI